MQNMFNLIALCYYKRFLYSSYVANIFQNTDIESKFFIHLNFEKILVLYAFFMSS